MGITMHTYNGKKKGKPAVSPQRVFATAIRSIFCSCCECLVFINFFGIIERKEREYREEGSFEQPQSLTQTLNIGI